MGKLRQVAIEFNLNLDFSPTGNKPVQEGTYTGWVHSLVKQAVKFPLPKRAKLLKMINGLLTGKTLTKTITGQPIKRQTKFFTKRELAQLHGSLNHFSNAHNKIFVKLTPLIRISNTVPEMDDLVFVSFTKEPWLFKVMSEIKDIVHENRWVPYEEIISTSRRYQNFELCFADAAGIDDLEDESYGIGGLSLSANFAFQIPHTIVSPFLQNLDTETRTPRPSATLNIWCRFSYCGSLLNMDYSNPVHLSNFARTTPRIISTGKRVAAGIRQKAIC